MAVAAAEAAKDVPVRELKSVATAPLIPTIKGAPAAPVELNENCEPYTTCTGPLSLSLIWKLKVSFG